ncbi:hypothetical protein [Mesorhizobium sanjuanii]|uniref:hypothetical protein n=1 Tax=Mesorhizobium sanjuanii TaxID=2037900 RepID=UPI001AD7F78D|nr:hypothetical protein [Mesorhizobium sanjuanii]
MKRVKKGAAELHSALSGMQSDNLVTLSAVFHIFGFGMHRPRRPSGLALNGSPPNGFPETVRRTVFGWNSVRRWLETV